MKILLVCYAYFPELSPRAFRWTAIAEELVRLGHQVDVVCAGSASQTKYECIHGVKIHRSGSNLRERLKRLLGLENTVTPVNNPFLLVAPASMRSRVGQIVRSAYYRTLRKILWPDFAVFWYFPALKRAHTLIQQSRPDVAVTVSLPFTGHLVGRALKRRYGIHWLVDIGDPFSFMTETPVNNTALFRFLNTRSESMVLALADAVTVTTEPTRQEYLRYFPTLERSKIKVLPPLFDFSRSACCVKFSKAAFNKVRLVFAGTLYRSIRNPTALLHFFRRLLATPLGPQLELHFYGVINDCQPCFEAYSDLINYKVFIHGLIPRVQAMRAMQEATVLVNLGNSIAYQLPSKVVEYVILGKPVLNITKLEADSSQSFFSDFNGVCNVSEYGLTSESGEFDKAKNFLENPPAIDPSHIEQFAQKHSTQIITQSYLALFVEAANRSQPKS